jgi:hypothetical protein
MTGAAQEVAAEFWSHIAVLCGGWRDFGAGREDKPGGMFQDRNRLRALPGAWLAPASGAFGGPEVGAGGVQEFATCEQDLPAAATTLTPEQGGADAGEE